MDLSTQYKHTGDSAHIPFAHATCIGQCEEGEGEEDCVVATNVSPYHASVSDHEEMIEPLLVVPVTIDEPTDKAQYEKELRRRRRRIRMMAAGTGGLIVGAAVFCGPLGPIVGAAAGALGAKVACKRRARGRNERADIEAQGNESVLT